MILITGANGQLGTELRFLFDENQIQYMGTDVKGLDITNKDAVDRYFDSVKIDVVIHCAAFTAVDKAEDEGKKLSYKINSEGTKNIAEAAKRVGATMVYISTDYVFDGTLTEEIKEDANTNPQNIYGETKLLGEQEVTNSLNNYYIIRTSWVFGKYGHNFVYTMRRLANEKDIITVVDDQVGRPTWTRTLAEFILFAIQNNIEFGTYHLSNDGSCTWFEFAKEILKNNDVEVIPVSSEQFPQKAKRPSYSVMSLEKAKSTGFKIPSWQEALDGMIKSL